MKIGRELGAFLHAEDDNRALGPKRWDNPNLDGGDKAIGETELPMATGELSVGI